jgi:uncharacterized protein
MGDFRHGVEIFETDFGPRPISGVDASVIGIVGTAKSGEAKINTPYLVSGSRKEAERLFGVPDTTAEAMPLDDTLPFALAGLLDQTGASIVVIKVTGKSEKEAPSDKILKDGVELLRGAESAIHKTPRILIAPGFSHLGTSTRDALASTAERLRGMTIIDGPNSNNADAIKAAKNVDSPRLYLVDPWVTIACGKDKFRAEPPSSRIAGVIAKSDSQRGFWFSPSNRPIVGIAGTSRGVDFALGDKLASANQLNEGNVSTIIHQNGYRLWGNRSCTADLKWVFISVRRTADLINDSLLRAHLWAVDRNITKTYVEDVTEGVNAYLRHLKSIGAIINGKCWADPELNTWDQITQGKVTFDFDFTPPYPAEHITFRSSMVNDYLEEIFA